MREHRPILLPESFPALRQSVVEQQGNVLASALAQLQSRMQQHDGQLPSGSTSTSAGGSLAATGVDQFNPRLIGANCELAPDTTWCSGGVAGNAAEEGSQTILRQDRRAFPRHESRCITVVLRHDEARPDGGFDSEWLLRASRLRGGIIDISMNGIAFTVDKPLEKGEEVVLRMLNRVFDRPVDKRAVIVRSSSLGRGQWKAVCQFQRTLSYDEVCLLGLQLRSPGLV